VYAGSIGQTCVSSEQPLTRCGVGEGQDAEGRLLGDPAGGKFNSCSSALISSTVIRVLWDIAVFGQSFLDKTQFAGSQAVGFCHLFVQSLFQ